MDNLKSSTSSHLDGLKHGGGGHLLSVQYRTERLRRSFMPAGIRIYNCSKNNLKTRQINFPLGIEKVILTFTFLKAVCEIVVVCCGPQTIKYSNLNLKLFMISCCICNIVCLFLWFDAAILVDPTLASQKTCTTLIRSIKK